MTNIEKANSLCKNTLMAHLGIVFTKVEEGHVEATMPVTQNHKQPMGLLHGGANLALAESVGSLASVLLIDIKKQAPVGLNLTSNHLKSVTSGTVKAIGTIIHQGRTTHIWNIDIFNEAQELLCSCRLTNYIKTL